MSGHPGCLIGREMVAVSRPASVRGRPERLELALDLGELGDLEGQLGGAALLPRG